MSVKRVESIIERGIGYHHPGPDVAFGKRTGGNRSRTVRGLDGCTRQAGDISAGRARLEIRPVPTGSPAAAITMGMSLVACRAAWTAGVREATIHIDLEANQLCGLLRKWGASAERTSSRMFWPSIRPAGLSATRASGLGLPVTRMPYS
jgi:hypothetical protein